MHEKFLNYAKNFSAGAQNGGIARDKGRKTHKIIPSQFGIFWRKVGKADRDDVVKQKQNHKIAHKIS